jgi:hypothetical protein
MLILVHNDGTGSGKRNPLARNVESGLPQVGNAHGAQTPGLSSAARLRPPDHLAPKQ